MRQNSIRLPRVQPRDESDYMDHLDYPADYEDYDEPDDYDPEPPLRTYLQSAQDDDAFLEALGKPPNNKGSQQPQYLTKEQDCGKIESSVVLTGNPQLDSNLISNLRRNKMATTQSGAATNKPTPAQEAAARAKAIADKQKEKQAAEKAKQAEAAQKAKDKAAADKIKAAEKAAALKQKEKEKAEAAKAREAAKKAKQAEKDAAKAAREKARAERAAERAANPSARLVPANLAVYVKDKERKTAGGNVSVDSGDKLAQELRGATLDQVYARAAKELNEKEADLRAKYKHLNPGMQRMNLGNRIRAAAAKGH